MGMPHITTFCWCMGLEVGARVVGYIHLLVSLAMVVVCSLSAASAAQLVGTVEDAEDHVYSRWHTAATWLAVTSVVHALLAVALLVAVHKRLAGLLRAWVLAMCALSAAAILFVLLSLILYGSRDSGSEIFVSVLEGVLFFCVVAYGILCVHSYSLVLRSSEDMEGPNKIDY